MERIRALAALLHSNEEGHALPGVGALVGAIGAILLGIGAANDSGALAITGGIVAGVGILASAVLSHRLVDWDIYDRLGKLEGKK